MRTSNHASNAAYRRTSADSGRLAHSVPSPPRSGANDALTFDLRCSLTREMAAASGPAAASTTPSNAASALASAAAPLPKCRAAHLGTPDNSATDCDAARRAATSASWMSNTPFRAMPFVIDASSSTDLSVTLRFVALFSSFSSPPPPPPPRSKHASDPSAWTSNKYTLSFGTAICTSVTRPIRDMATPSQSTAMTFPGAFAMARTARSRASPGEDITSHVSSRMFSTARHRGHSSTGRAARSPESDAAFFFPFFFFFRFPGDPFTPPPVSRSHAYDPPAAEPPPPVA
eukprot:31439-Pelagococcus_subviridis.AAC.16